MATRCRRRTALMLVWCAVAGCFLGVSAMSRGCNKIALKSADDSDVNYDLTALYKTNINDAYQVEDKLRADDFDYYFNVCGALPALPPFCNASTSRTNPFSAAYQLHTHSENNPCVSLGDEEHTTYALIDPVDPGIGVEIQYGNGDVCGTGPSAHPRTLTVRVYCDQTGNRSTTEEPFVLEDACDYTVELLSVHGCPLGCKYQSTLCSGKGFCSIDGNANKVKCFCYDGFAGDFCEKKATKHTKKSDPTGALIAVVIILLLGLLGMAFVLYKKMKKLRVEGEGPAYGRMEDTGRTTVQTH